jgi:hypothetical protein
MRRPDHPDVAKAKVLSLYEGINGYKTHIADTVRAGVHVHIDVGNLSIREMFNFATVYYVLEVPLTNFCGPGRQGNHFCLRGVDSDTTIRTVCNAIDSRQIDMVNNDYMRYAALNFCSLFKFGSLEFRAMRTPTRPDNILLWIDTLVSMLDASKEFNNPIEMIEGFSLDGADQFMRRVLGDNYKLFSSQPTLEKDLRSGIRLAQEIAYSTMEWE